MAQGLVEAYGLRDAIILYIIPLIPAAFAVYAAMWHARNSDNA